MKLLGIILLLLNTEATTEIGLEYAKQSSTLDKGDCGPAYASNPLENKQDTRDDENWLKEGSCACAATKKEKNAYWKAKLEEYSKVKSVEILQRNKDFKGQDNSMDIYIDG